MIYDPVQLRMVITVVYIANNFVLNMYVVTKNSKSKNNLIHSLDLLCRKCYDMFTL